MNRQDRRKYAKTINTPKQLEMVVDRALRERERQLEEIYKKKLVDYLEVMVVMTAYVLNAEGFGKKRLPNIINRILFNIDSFRTGELNRDDYEYIKKEMEKLGVKM